MHFRRLAVIETSAAIVAVAVTIVAAILHAGAYSLVLGPVAGTVAQSVGLWVNVPWRPSATWVPQELSRLWAFGKASLVSTRQLLVAQRG